MTAIERSNLMRASFIQPGDEISLPGIKRASVLSAQTVEAGYELQTIIRFQVEDATELLKELVERLRVLNKDNRSQPIEIVLHHIH